MSLGLIIYVILFSVVISTFIMGYILSKRFPNSKLHKFWKKHIIGDVDMDEFN
jgi:hypothetical protein